MDGETRTLRIEIPPCIVEKQPGENFWSTTDLINGWSAVLGGQPLFWTGTIDLGGYAREMKRFYPSAGMIQQGMFLLQEGGDGAWMVTTVSSITIDLEALFLTTAFGGGLGFLDHGNVGGFQNQNWETVIFNETQLYVTNQNIQPNLLGIMQGLSEEQTGSLSPTASDTLYVAKMIIPNDSSDTMTKLTIPASRVILPGKFGTEPDVEYMMRLKRSTERSQQV